jgi:hypothetical protein
VLEKKSCHKIHSFFMTDRRFNVPANVVKIVFPGSLNRFTYIGKGRKMNYRLRSIFFEQSWILLVSAISASSSGPHLTSPSMTVNEIINCNRQIPASIQRFTCAAADISCTACHKNWCHDRKILKCRLFSIIFVYSVHW